MATRFFKFLGFEGIPQSMTMVFILGLYFSLLMTCFFPRDLPGEAMLGGFYHHDNLLAVGLLIVVPPLIFASLVGLFIKVYRLCRYHGGITVYHHLPAH